MMSYYSVGMFRANILFLYKPFIRFSHFAIDYTLLKYLLTPTLVLQNIYMWI